MGSLILIDNFTDLHGQVFLRSHDELVCALAVSPSGELLASGQLGTTHFKGNAAPIFLWQTQSRLRLSVLRGLVGRVTNIAFSDDERFVCGTDSDSMMYVWDLNTAEVVFGHKFLHPVSVMAWTGMKKDRHNMQYELVFGAGSVLYQGIFTYDDARVQWSMKFTLFQMPVQGALIRQFNCISLSPDRIFVYVGTSVGEMMVFRRDTVVFRACIPVCHNGLNGIETMPNGSVLCGGGDGSLHLIKGQDMSWQMAMESKVDSAIFSMSLSANKTEILVSCASGNMYRFIIGDRALTSAIVAKSHTSPVTAIGFGRRAAIDQIRKNKGMEIQNSPSLFFATGTSLGELRVWDLADYACISYARFHKSGSIKCICMVDDDTVLSGWDDGAVRCTDRNGREKWCLPTAHARGTLSIAIHMDEETLNVPYFVTGGADGAVRVWKYHNRELILQYSEHRKGVARVIIDEVQPNIVHSVGGDCSVLSYDLKAARRMMCHIVNTGMMLGMSQRKDSERELVTCDTLGRLLYWDIDVRDPVLAVQDPSHYPIRAMEVSPTGRFIAFAGDDFILKVLDTKEQLIVSLGQSHSAPIISLAWTPDERQIITGGEDSCLSVWNFHLGGY